MAASDKGSVEHLFPDALGLSLNNTYKKGLTIYSINFTVPNISCNFLQIFNH